MLNLLFISIIILLVWVIYNLYGQVQTLENTLNTEIGEVEKRANGFYIAILAILAATYNELERVDKNGAFSSDDEVGFAFKAIITAISEAKNRIQMMQGDDASDE